MFSPKIEFFTKKLLAFSKKPTFDRSKEHCQKKAPIKVDVNYLLDLSLISFGENLYLHAQQLEAGELIYLSSRARSPQATLASLGSVTSC